MHLPETAAAEAQGWPGSCWLVGQPVCTETMTF